MNTWRLHIKGQVQGVGFRPFIYRLAKDMGLDGWVSNTSDGVHLEINSSKTQLDDFVEKIYQLAPPLARITGHQEHKINLKKFSDFQILPSEEHSFPNLLLTPDTSLCLNCKEELYQPQNRRYHYPFITCTNCGPRYSIIQQLPYDREMTTMNVFSMCSICNPEYENPLDRRFYSQTNSCPKCEIKLSLFNNQKRLITKNSKQIIKKITQLWEEGKIIAIKGIGGYLLTCDAQNEQVIRELRKRKHRPSKPFALMYPNYNSLAIEMDLQKEERRELQHHVAPIVLLSPVLEILSTIAPNLNQIGVMLPYTPLYEMLLKTFGKPIIATSGNISNSPIVFEDKKALEQLSSIADFVLMNNREIVVPQDDSVIKFTSLNKQKIILRRSRGLAPNYINAELSLVQNTILSAGALLKSTFTFLHQGNVFVSQYLGDLESFDTQENYRQTVHHFFDLFKSKPEIILCDLHPDYASSQFAAQLAQELNLPLFKIQHHLAHFSALLGEHNLIHSEEPILGVIWDGTGLGEDGQIWGGEFFIYDNHQFERYAHLEYFDFILRNKMPKEPRISALSLSKNNPEVMAFIQKKFSEEEWRVYTTILNKESPLKTSSMGRLFDAVASLLNVCDQQSYEGEAALILENLALDYFKSYGMDFPESYFSKSIQNNSLKYEAAIFKIIQDIQNGKTKNFIAAKFHYSLVQSILEIAINASVRKIAFSGGVFQNGVLVDLLLHYLGKDYKLLFHQDLSPNDENISFGQLIYYHIQQFSGNK